MGGYGSGRRGGPPTAEATGSFHLTMKDLSRLMTEPAAMSRLTFQNGWGERLKLDVVKDLEGDRRRLIFLHSSFTTPAKKAMYPVQLTMTRPTYGGVRWWFVCPSSGRRAFRLFLPRGGRYFLSRPAYGLGYGVQRIDALARHQRRCAKVLAKLGKQASTFPAYAPIRPKGMRQRTYERLCAELDTANEQVECQFLQGAQRILDRCGRSRW